MKGKLLLIIWCMLFLSLVLFYQVYVFLSTNGVNWDCPNQEAMNAMEKYAPNAMSASMCLAACRKVADIEKREIQCRCPSSEYNYCFDEWIFPTIKVSTTMTSITRSWTVKE
jgi:hypothetical protein